jgi:hypothetical protein
VLQPGRFQARLSSPTASPAPATSLSSSSLRLLLDLGSGLNIGLARDIDVRNVGLDVMQTGRDNISPEDGKEPPIVGDDAAELAVELGNGIEMGIGNREGPLDVRVTMAGDMRG